MGDAADAADVAGSAAPAPAAGEVIEQQSPGETTGAATASTEEKKHEEKRGGEEKEENTSAIYLKEEVPEGEMDDLAGLTNLNEDTLLHEIKVRYEANNIYTYVSDILIAVNPFKDLGLYGAERAAKYNKIMRSDQPPHLFAVADASFHQLFEQRKDQCLVISGESGAGKTYAAKIAIKHILDLSRNRRTSENNGKGFEAATATTDDGAATTTKTLEDRIVQVSPLLEAFGNAQTCMNDNSSRFGKYTRLLFDIEGAAMGVQISEYLLEKSRVVEQHPKERNFHAFYYLMACPDVESKYLLRPSDKHSALSGTPWDDNAAMYAELVQAMKDVGFSDEEQAAIHTLLAAILHLTDVNFEGDDVALMVGGAHDVVRNVATLLQVDLAALKQALLVRHTVTRGEHIDRPYTREGAYDTRDAAAKNLYQRTFSWVVGKVNAMLAPGLHLPSNARPGVQARAARAAYEVGVLDIFGFENFESNSFEQLCINVAHEQLQFFFNQHTFRLELEEYEKEGIDGVKKISFTDNKPLLSMFLDRGPSLFGLLDEECTFPRATDDTFVGKINAKFTDHAFYEYLKKSRGYPAFAIKHFPGTVEYNATGFLEKNRDNLAADMVAVLQASAHPVVNTICNSDLSETGALVSGNSSSGSARIHRGVVVDSGNGTSNTASRRAPSLGMQFRNSLSDLVAKMMACNPHFVRCIKPNLAQAPDNFVPEFVKVQLGYTGVLEATRIRREGYSWRPTFDEFVRRFKILAFPYEKLKRVQHNAHAARKIIEAVGIAPALVGRTKLFLKWNHVEEMENALRAHYLCIIKCQSAVRAWFARKVYARKIARARMSAEARAAEEAKEAAEQKAREEARLERERQEAERLAAELARQTELARVEQAKAEAEAHRTEEARRAREIEHALLEVEARKAEAEAQRLRDLRVAEKAQEEAEELRQQAAAAEQEKELIKLTRQMSLVNRKAQQEAAEREAAERNRAVAELEKQLNDARAAADQANSRSAGLQRIVEEEEAKSAAEAEAAEMRRRVADLSYDGFDLKKWIAYRKGLKDASDIVLPDGIELSERRLAGPVWKTGQRNKQWKKRWFVLECPSGKELSAEGGEGVPRLDYYDNAKAKKPKGSISGEDILRVFAPRKAQKTKNAWLVEIEDRTYFAKCATKEETDFWVSAVLVFIDHFQSADE